MKALKKKTSTNKEILKTSLKHPQNILKTSLDRSPKILSLGRSLEILSLARSLGLVMNQLISVPSGCLRQKAFRLRHHPAQRKYSV